MTQHVRTVRGYILFAFAVALAMVTYLDRVCISTVAKDIRHDLSISEQQMGYVFSAFSVAYVVFEIPTAWWADRRGTRSVLTRTGTMRPAPNLRQSLTFNARSAAIASSACLRCAGSFSFEAALQA